MLVDLALRHSLKYVIIHSVTMERNEHNVIPRNKLKHYMLAKLSFLFQHKQGFKNM